jgi:hypothetical protein
VRLHPARRVPQTTPESRRGKTPKEDSCRVAPCLRSPGVAEPTYTR